MESASGGGSREAVSRGARRGPSTLPSPQAMWTESTRARRSAFPDLDSPRSDLQTRGENTRYLSWVERQRLVDSHPSPLWPMLVALGMLCVVSMSLAGDDSNSELRRVLQERSEVLFVPHEAETLHERPVEVEMPDVDSEAESDVLLLRKKHEFMAKDEGDRSLEWVENHLTLGDILFKPDDYNVLLSQTPAVVRAILQRKVGLENSKGHSKIAILLQQDLAAVAELIQLCRILSAAGSLDRAQAARLQGLLKLAAQRFGQEWPEALTLIRYVADTHERNLCLRLVSVVTRAIEAMGNSVLAAYAQDGGAVAGHPREELSWKILTARFEIERLLKEANFPGEFAEAFRAD